MNKALVLAEWERAAKAALQLRGVEADSHAAVKRLFGLHVIQAGLVEAEWGSFAGESLDLRLTADYDVQTRFSDTDAREECERARAFLSRIRDLLLASGLTPEELRTEVLDG